MLVSVENMDTQATVVPTHICLKNERVKIVTGHGVFHIQYDGAGGFLLSPCWVSN